jgi:hypothetical protein
MGLLEVPAVFNTREAQKETLLFVVASLPRQIASPPVTVAKDRKKSDGNVLI